jgi:uncharacterized protein YdhG (YjbR/CyaY superfamily)
MYKAVEEYINKQPERQREILRKIRETIKRIIPGAEEKISYGAPAFKLEGKTIMYAGYKNHVSIFPQPGIIERFSKELEGYETSKGTIKFELNQPIPYLLIEKIVRAKFESK